LHHSQIVSSILGVSQLFIFKQRSLAFVAATIAISTVQANASQAAIVGGQFTGIWTSNFTKTGGLNIGDTFTADYTYDDSQIFYTTPSSTDYSLKANVNLLSLIVSSSGTTFQNFNFNNTSASGTIYGRYLKDSVTGMLSDQISVEITASDFVYPTTNYFSAFSTTSSINGVNSTRSYAGAYFTDFRSGQQSGAFASAFGAGRRPITFSGAFPDPALVPTPALLPGLIGMGLGMLRKRRQVAPT
jgi:hypothetical protein